MDMVMVPQRYREFFTTLVGLVKAGEVPMSRIDDAVTRILRVKAAMGLLYPRSPLADRSLRNQFGSASHRQLARRAGARVAGALEERSPHAAALEDAKRIHVAGKNATTSATSAAAGRSTGKARAARSPKAPRSWPRSARPRRRRRSRTPRTAAAPRALKWASS
jgi:beta-glucosidase-like glycosyl hydrolase